ncbi:MAG TPA: glycosyltransferase, partial [Gammaproteobacteria bacterium]|nr:glycosyltransferase [Gammaproteobacteria bacterium]
MIAFHFPPASISSGIQRTLKFSTYLPEFGWKPNVLTVHPRAYESTGSDQMGDIPQDLVVRRAFSLNAARHMTLAGRYPLFLALPDRWSSWWLGGIVSGLKMIREQRPDVLWSTYPIATAHLIALTLHRLTSIPWVADCRDSMTE